jgi:hypothetical protein
MNVYSRKNGVHFGILLSMVVLLIVGIAAQGSAAAGASEKDKEPRAQSAPGKDAPKAGNTDQRAGKGTAKDAKAAEGEQEKELSPWYFFAGNINNHPRLERSDREVDRELNQPLRLIAPGFDDVKTFSDQANAFMIWTPFLGVGRVLGDHWDAYFQTGYVAGNIQTHQTHASLLLLPLHSDVIFKRSTFLAGVGANWYPWGLVRLAKYDSLMERLKHSKPFIGTSMCWNRLTYKARARTGFRPFGTLVEIDKSDAWEIWNNGVNVGVDIPVTRRAVFCANAQYNFFLAHGDDFDGPSFSFFWKIRF